MIIGVILKNFKCYKGLHYIPLTNAGMSNYCGLIGLNGVGKSAILEALDCFFNDSEFERNNWGNNDNTKNYPLSHLIEDSKYIIPIFSLNKDCFKNNVEILNLVEAYSNFVQLVLRIFYNKIEQLTISNYTTSLKYFQTTKTSINNNIVEHLKSLQITNDFLLPIGIDYRNAIIEGGIFDEFEFSLFKNIVFESQDSDYAEFQKYRFLFENKSILLKIIKSIKEQYTYIFIPKEIDPKRFSKFETKEIQQIISLNLKEVLTRKQEQLINSRLSIWLKQLPISGKDFIFKERRQDIYKVISNMFLTNYELYKDCDISETPFSKLSTGEQHQAILSLIYYSVKNSKMNESNIIIAIDEPETSLHISQCFEQFNRLYELSTKGAQICFASHWYGFIPSIPDGCVVNIVENNGKRSVSVLDIYKYKEEAVRLPVDLSLKGNSELIQTILSTILIDNCYNWLICEGTSDKIYLEECLKDEITDKNLRIIPVGGCSHIKKIYSYLALSLLDLKIADIKGHIFMLVDTDDDKVDEYKNPELPKEIKKYHECNVIHFKRLVNIKKTKKTILSEFSANTKTATDMEGVLNGKAFNKVIINNFKGELAFVTEDEKPEIPSAFALDLKDSEKEALKTFFTPQNKVRFARAYVEELQKGIYKVPDWITEIKKFFNS